MIEEGDGLRPRRQSSIIHRQSSMKKGKALVFR
jgi:hypothetical protein